MNHLILWILLVTIYSKSFGQQWHSMEYLDTLRQSYVLEEYDIHSCKYADTLAQTLFKENRLILITGERYWGSKKFLRFVKKYYIEIIPIGCIRKIKVTCFNDFMGKKIDKKFGEGTYLKILNAPSSLFNF